MSQGHVPSERELKQLVAWLGHGSIDDVVATDRLSSLWAPARAFEAVASGVLAISISRLHSSDLLCFRREHERTVRWGGDPRVEARPDASSPSTGPMKFRASASAWRS